MVTVIFSLGRGGVPRGRPLAGQLRGTHLTFQGSITVVWKSRKKLEYGQRHDSDHVRPLSKVLCRGAGRVGNFDDSSESPGACGDERATTTITFTGLFVDVSCNSRSSHGKYTRSSTEQLQYGAVTNARLLEQNYRDRNLNMGRDYIY